MFQECKNENYIAVAIHLNKNKNLWLRSKFIHQHKQVKFPPDSFVTLLNATCFSQKQIIQCFNTQVLKTR